MNATSASRSAFFPVILAATLSACGGRPAAIVAAPPPPVAAPVAVAVEMPRGASPGMETPPLLADGTYATPNRDLSEAATVWHLRAALNVAALACRGAEGDAIVAGYNQLLARDKAPLAAAEARYAAEFRAAGGDWRDRYDDGMTRLYNFFSQAPARDDFCAAAAATLADAAFVDDATLPAFASGRLAVLERPFTDFYRAYDAWRASTTPPVYALAAAPAPVPAPVVAGATTANATAPHPRLELDLSALADPAPRP